MNRATPEMRNIAARILAAEIRTASKAGTTAVPPVTDRLRPHLAALMGHGGVRALFARSLALACAEVPWLKAAQVNADGDFEGLNALAKDLGPDAFFEGKVVLLAQLLVLLVAFIGPSLTSRLIGEVWPQIPLRERDFGKENDREKAK